MQDQAEKLRQLVSKLNTRMGVDMPSPKRVSHSCRVLAVTSGKGGVGKSNLAVNLGLAMVKKGHRVLVFDADMGLANVDVLLGLIPQYTLAHLLYGQKSLSEIVLQGPENLQLVASGSGGVQELANMNDAQREKFLKALEGLQDKADIIIIDTGAGMHRNVLAFALAAGEVILVTTPEPTALIDAYGMVKVLNMERKNPIIRVIVNMAGSQQEADEAGKKLVVLSKKFLNADLEYLGYVPRDMGMIKAVREQRPVCLGTPTTSSGISIARLAEVILSGVPSEEGGSLGMFFKRVTELFGGKSYGR
jgi:flagellar biosynthesis protein FlhG